MWTLAELAASHGLTIGQLAGRAKAAVKFGIFKDVAPFAIMIVVIVLSSFCFFVF